MAPSSSSSTQFEHYSSTSASLPAAGSHFYPFYNLLLFLKPLQSRLWQWLPGLTKAKPRSDGIFENWEKSPLWWTYSALTRIVLGGCATSRIERSSLSILWWCTVELLYRQCQEFFSAIQHTILLAETLQTDVKTSQGRFGWILRKMESVPKIFLIPLYN